MVLKIDLVNKRRLVYSRAYGTFPNLFEYYLFKILVSNRGHLVRSVTTNITQVLHLPTVVFAYTFHLHSTILTNPIILENKVWIYRFIQNKTFKELLKQVPISMRTWSIIDSWCTFRNETQKITTCKNPNCFITLNEGIQRVLKLDDLQSWMLYL